MIEHFKLDIRLMDRALILQRILSKEISQVEACKLLDLTDRHVRRLVKKFRADGCKSLIFEHVGGNRKTRDAIKSQIMEIINDKYSDFGPTFASEKLAEDHELKINKETLRQWMIEAELWQGKQRCKVHIHQSRERRSRFGELVQIDGSPHDWFEGRSQKCCLLVMIDDATSRLVGLRFEDTETTFGYMRCIETYIKQYGRPIAFYADKHSIFRKTAQQCVDRFLEETQLHRGLKELNIELICANSPQAKGRVERANNTLQDRLVKEIRLRNINNIDEGNAYLQEFMKSYNKKFSVEPANAENAHRNLSCTDEELELILSKIATRKVSKNLEFSYKKQIFQIQGEGKGHRLRQSQVQIYETCHGEIKLMYGRKPLDYSVLEINNGPKEAGSKEINNVVDLLCKAKLPVLPTTPQPQIGLAI